jgi:formylglycine-generating enzyme required for sulfatase activity
MRLENCDPRIRLSEGDRLKASGDVGQAIVVWTEALASLGDDPSSAALRMELGDRLVRVHRHSAYRRGAALAVAVFALLPFAIWGALALADQADARRQLDADRALEDARTLLTQGGPAETVEALGAVATRYPGTDAARDARTLATDFGGYAVEVQATAEEAGRLLERGAAGAASRLSRTLLKERRFPGSALTAELRRLNERAEEVAELQAGARALEEREFSKAVSLFEGHDETPEARRGAAAARFGELSERGQQALEREDFAQALASLREANRWAARALQPERNLDALTQTWAELRRVRAELALNGASLALARGDRHSAQLQALVADDPDEVGLVKRLVTLTGRIAEGIPHGMRFVPAGETPQGDVLSPDELPLGLVRVAAFLIDTREVSRAEYGRFLSATGHPEPPRWHEHPPTDSELPVTGVTWGDASAYATWSHKRLPTELEWEAAARMQRVEADDERSWLEHEAFVTAWRKGLEQASRHAEAGWAKLGQDAAHRGEPLSLKDLAGAPKPIVSSEGIAVSPRAALNLLLARRWPWGGFWDGSRCPSGGTRPEAAGAAGASPWGVEDLAGSVSEWTASEYRPYSGPLRASSEGKGQRVVRGGSFRSVPDEARATWRTVYAPTVRFDDLGFRCARDL